MPQRLMKDSRTFLRALSLTAGGVQEFKGIHVIIACSFYWDGAYRHIRHQSPPLGTASKWIVQKDSAEKKISDRVLTFPFKWMHSLY